MNPTSSYTIPDYPQLKPDRNNPQSRDSVQINRAINQQMREQIPNRNPSGNGLGGGSKQKHMLYYSNYCKHSKTLLEHLQKEGLISNLELICIDNRYVKENITYIKLSNNQTFPLPPMINCVPTLCLMPNHEILTGSKIMNYFKPINETIQDERNNISLEPNPYCLEKETNGSYGVSSDNFSFYDSTHDDLSASGNGGTRQMYNYASIEGGHKIGQPIYTPQDEGKEQKINISLEQLQQRRNNEL